MFRGNEVRFLPTFNSINFQILGIPAYLFCAFTGFVFMTCVYIMLMSSKKYDIEQSVKVLLISIFGMLAGAKIFGILTEIYRKIGNGEKVTFTVFRDTGIVFYGGLFGALIIYWLCLRLKHCVLDRYAMDVFAVCIPLFHSMARVGCFLAGCCFGKFYKGIFSINYITTIDGSINESMRFPVQLVESAFEFLVFLYLLKVLNSDHWREEKILMKYLSLYSIGRFMLEYLRGDVRRGIICGVSFSQCISVFIWINLIIFHIRQYKVCKQKGGL